jgi:KUP system potassium uptake protein
MSNYKISIYKLKETSMKLHENSKLLPLMVGAIGVVYGDIGTSPLYALSKCFLSHNLPLTFDNIAGIISLIIWTLLIIVSLKYISLIFRADNQGEGGILTLMTLCLLIKSPGVKKIVMLLGVVGTTLFYGDGVITPAISVLSALEGLSIVSHRFDPYIPYLGVVILILLFSAQRKGSSRIGRFFGPIMIMWFLTLALLGLPHIFQAPQILHALNPYYGILFLLSHNYIGIMTFGAIVLVVTGAEALYADLGHFNKKSIRLSWTYLVFPSLILNYLGQGALLTTDPSAIKNIFYLLAPSWALYSLIFLSTLATIIASQSIISGIFSMSWQAIQLGYLPRLQVIHTSVTQIGQIYIPLVNYILLTLTILTVILFRNSDNLASAYGITVTGIMVITTILAALLSFYIWQWSLLKVVAIFTPLLLIDLTFFLTSLDKILDGGWFPVLVTLATYWVMTTWYQGRKQLEKKISWPEFKTPQFIKNALKHSPQRIPGMAIYLSRLPDQVPSALATNILHNKFLHQYVVILSIVITDTPRVMVKDSIKITEIAKGVHQLYHFPNLLLLRRTADSSSVL